MSSRDPWFDNAKMALVTLVVVGHSWVLLPDSAYAYDLLYAWHVPAFVFVTGYLSRGFAYTPERLWSLVRTVAVPYVVFEAAIALFRVYVGGEALEGLFADPHWPMWYLSALFFWRLATPPFKALRGRVAVPLAVAISLVAGLYAGDTLDAARICGLLPFFVAGLHTRAEGLERLRHRAARPLALLGFAAIAVLARYTDTLASTEWLYYRSRYAELDVSDAHAFAIRAGLLVVGAVGAAAFLALVPRRGGWFARLGASTLVVYLFHGFVVKGAEYAGYADWTAAHPVLAFPVTTAAAVGVALLLAAPAVASRLTHLVDPLGYAEQRLRAAGEVAAATDRADVLAERLQAHIEQEQAREELVTGSR